jgi:hypothetical protein
MAFFIEIEKNTKIHMESPRTQNSQSNPEQKNNAGGITTLDFKLYYRAILTKESMILTSKLACKPMEQNRKSRGNPTQLWPSDS